MIVIRRVYLLLAVSISVGFAITSGCAPGPTLTDAERIDANCRAVLATIKKAKDADQAGQLDNMAQLGEEYAKNLNAYSGHLLSLSDQDFEKHASQIVKCSTEIGTEIMPLSQAAAKVFCLPSAARKEDREREMKCQTRISTVAAKLGGIEKLKSEPSK